MRAKIKEEIPRNSLLWLLAANLAAIVPHVTRLPLWIVGMCVFCLLYRLLVLRGIFPFPRKFWCAFLVISGGISIFLHFGAGLGPEAGVALLIMSFSLKLLEMSRFRDAYLQVILAYFVLATEFLFNNNALMTVYLYVVMIMNTAALIGLNQTSASFGQMLRLAFSLSMQALPIMVVLFVFFPRITPLWGISMIESSQTNGLNESMTPDDIAQLGRTDRRVFRAEFAGAIPDQEQLYWRGLVFSAFDGRTWSVLNDGSSKKNNNFSQLDIRVEPPGLDYSVMLDPSDQMYLFALDMPQILQSDIVFNSNFTLTSSQPIVQPLVYKLRSFLNYQAQPNLTDKQRIRELHLPLNSNPRSQQLARQWIKEVGHDPEKMTKKILQWFSQEKFFYTLSPPKLVDNIVDQFLFETKEGYCSFYAGAMVFLLRAAGIPSRVVVGYMGGEINPLGNYVIVNQYDAHAWIEVWYEGKGWTRVDPTAAVAPERIRDSVQRGLSEQAGFLKDYPHAMSRYRYSSGVRQVWRALDYAGFTWQRFVVGYNQDQQQKFIESFFKNGSVFHLAIAALIMVMGLLSIIAWCLLRSRQARQGDVLTNAYLYFCQQCAKNGLSRHASETPYQFAARLILVMPQLKTQIDELTQLYIQKQYQSSLEQKARKAAAKKLLQLVRASIGKRIKHKLSFNKVNCNSD